MMRLKTKKSLGMTDEEWQEIAHEYRRKNNMAKRVLLINGKEVLSIDLKATDVTVAL